MLYIASSRLVMTMTCGVTQSPTTVDHRLYNLCVDLSMDLGITAKCVTINAIISVIYGCFGRHGCPSRSHSEKAQLLETFRDKLADRCQRT